MSFVTTDPQSHVGNTDIWLTPLELVSRLSDCGFDLDPCGHEGHITARNIYHPPQDGLKLPWHGKVYLNPPYSEAEKWVEKLIEHGYGVALLFARTDNKYFQRMIRACDSIQFIKGRISFIKPDGTKKSNAGAASIAFFFGCKPSDPSLGAIKE